VEVSHVQMMSKKKKTLAVKVEIPRGVSPDPDVSIFMSKPFKLADQQNFQPITFVLLLNSAALP
jgi:hypothetical protein